MIDTNELLATALGLTGGWKVVGSEFAAAGGLRRILVDKTSARRGHWYVTNFVDEQTGELLFMTPGKGAAVCEEFALR